MTDGFGQGGIFLVNTLFNLYIFALLLRLILQWMGASFFNPVSQFIVKITDPVIQPLRRVLPRVRMVDIATLLAACVLELIKYSLLLWIAGGSINIIALLLIALVALIKATVNIFFYAILISVVLSWVNPGLHSPVTEIIYRLTEPLLAPVRRIIPPISGFDLSPIVVLLGLQLILIVLLRPLMGGAL